LEKLQGAVGKMVEFLDKAVAKRDPSAALAAPEQDTAGGADASQAAAVSVGRFTSMPEAAAALAAVADYFSRSEASSPALLLVRQARQLVGKSFLEVMRVLVPNEVDRAMINIGSDQFFDLPVERLSPFSPDANVSASTGSQDQSGWSQSGETEGSAET